MMTPLAEVLEAAVDAVIGDVGERDVVVMTNRLGGVEIRAVNEQEWGELVHTSEVLGSRLPVGRRFRRQPDGHWVEDGGWRIA